ncbi:hNH endonuclease [Escherichia coli]|uniref:hNH endonuclease n=1 Tax=Escherichia coli TaxID=562 RepID=UPI001CBC87DD|nr:hNH endonuclease [Escherichia coli]EEW2545740.1 hNH endonuclease [Escherichia coli]UAP54535.1 hNH endonuclease [Escherichia coli]UAP58917.1 hNH endonuclease [Escherichia coli]
MKQMSLIEMDGFLKGKCIPGDLKVNETNAEYLVRKFGELESKLETALRECRSAGITIDNLEAKCTALAAENAGMKSVIEYCINPDNQPEYHDQGMGCGVEDHGYQRDGYSACYYGWESAMERVYSEVIPDAIPETQATDAFLDEVRAQAFNDLCSVFVKDATVIWLDDGDIVTVKEATDALLHCAEQLSKGGNQ